MQRRYAIAMPVCQKQLRCMLTTKPCSALADVATVPSKLLQLWHMSGASAEPRPLPTVVQLTRAHVNTALLHWSQQCTGSAQHKQPDNQPELVGHDKHRPKAFFISSNKDARTIAQTCMRWHAMLQNASGIPYVA
jgi:hypothetical protein